MGSAKHYNISSLHQGTLVTTVLAIPLRLAQTGVGCLKVVWWVYIDIGRMRSVCKPQLCFDACYSCVHIHCRSQAELWSCLPPLYLLALWVVVVVVRTFAFPLFREEHRSQTHHRLTCGHFYRHLTKSSNQLLCYACPSSHILCCSYRSNNGR